MQLFKVLPDGCIIAKNCLDAAQTGDTGEMGLDINSGSG